MKPSRCSLVLLLVFATSARSQSSESSAEDYNKLGWHYFNQARIRDMPMRGIPQEYKRATEVFNKAIELKPDYADSYMGLAIAYNRLGNHQEALIAIKRVIETEPDLAGAYTQLGVAYQGLHRYEEAIQAFQEEIRLNDIYPIRLVMLDGQMYPLASCNFLNYLTLGHMYMELERFQEAISEYNQAARIKSRESGVWSPKVVTLRLPTPDS